MLPREMCRAFGAGSLAASETISLLSHELSKQPQNAGFCKWQSLKYGATGCDTSVWQKSHDLIVKKLLSNGDNSAKTNSSKINSAALLFAVETYFATVVRAFLRLVGQHEPAAAAIYRLPDSIRDLKTGPKTESQIANIENSAKRFVTSDMFRKSQRGIDLFGNLYAHLLPAAARKQLGEFYTPAWLADHLLDFVGFDGAVANDSRVRVLDPACGSGTFLLAAARRLLKAGLPPEQIAYNVAGFDLNPLAVLMSTANLAMTLAPRDGAAEIAKPPQIICHDSIRNISPQDGVNAGETFGRFDFVVGNPPWLAWDKLPPDYREQTKTLWQRYGLFNLSGKDARYGGAKKELALLLVMTSADHFLKTGGRLAMVLPQTVFQTHKTGDGFRRFGGDDPELALKVLRVDDFSAMRVFRDATTKTATLVLEKGRPTSYPVPYFCWQTPEVCHPCHAVSIVPERSGSPWRIIDPGTIDDATSKEGCVSLCSPHETQKSQKSDYTAMLGANTGGANGIYWVEIVSACQNGLVTVRNLAACGKQQLPVIEAEIEAEIVFPLLRWRDIGRFSARPSTWSIIVQDPATRTGLSLEVMQAKYPKTLAFLREFEMQLRNRAAYRKYLPDSPFYSMYNISRETFAPLKVVWRRMDTRIRAAVVSAFQPDSIASNISATDSVFDSPDLSFAQARPVIPQETCSMIAANGIEEAYYLAALLNSEAVHRCVAASSVQGGKGFGSPGMMEHLPIRRFDANNDMHMKLARLGREAKDNPECDGTHAEINLLADRVLERLHNELPLYIACNASKYDGQTPGK